MLSAFVSQAQEVYVIDTKYPVHDVMSHLLIIEDAEHKLTPNILLTDSTLQFSKRSDHGRFLRPNGTYWGKINIRSNEKLNFWTLQLEDRFIGPPAYRLRNGMRHDADPDRTPYALIHGEEQDHSPDRRRAARGLRTGRPFIDLNGARRQPGARTR